jgi:UDP-N-acetylglucosamine 2-epimerase (non-hydrolysing)
MQEETTGLGIPCVTVRANTERPVTVESGTNIVAGTGTVGIRDAIRRQMNSTSTGSVPDKWDGQAAERILDVLLARGNQLTSRAPAKVVAAVET